jgi:23S rRNA pseudouridine1911/1915/1917 synthase
MSQGRIPTLVVPSVSSTMDAAAEQWGRGGAGASGGTSGRADVSFDVGSSGLFAVAARVQTQGRGRRGRSWIQGTSDHENSRDPTDGLGAFQEDSSERWYPGLAAACGAFGDALPLSVVFARRHVRVPLEWLSLAVGCAVYDAAEDLSIFCQAAWPELEWIPLEEDKRLYLKWPNDLVVLPSLTGGGCLGKIAGVLIETAGSGTGIERVAVGLGLNLMDAPGVHASNARSLVDVLHGHWLSDPAGMPRSGSQLRKKFLRFKADPSHRAVLASRFFESFERELIEYLTVPRTIGQLRSLALGRMLPIGLKLRVSDERTVTPGDALGTLGCFVGLGDDASLLLQSQEFGSVEKVYAGDVSLVPIDGPHQHSQHDSQKVRRGEGREFGRSDPTALKGQPPTSMVRSFRSGVSGTVRPDEPVLRSGTLLLDLGNTRCHWHLYTTEAPPSGDASDDWGHINYGIVPSDSAKRSKGEPIGAHVEGRGKLPLDESLRSLLALLSSLRRGSLRVVYISVKEIEWSNQWVEQLQFSIVSAFPEMKVSVKRIDLPHLRHAEPALDRVLENYGTGLGVDRALKFLFAAQQASELDAPVCVLSLGTALTLEIVDAQKRLIDSLISPGIQMAFDVLHEKTDRLPLIELHNLPLADESPERSSGTLRSLSRGVVLPIVHVLAGLSTRYGVQRIWLCGGSAARFLLAAGDELARVSLPAIELSEDLGLLALRRWLTSQPDALPQSGPERVLSPMDRDPIRGTAAGSLSHGVASVSTLIEPVVEEKNGQTRNAQSKPSLFAGLGAASRRVAESLYAGRRNLRAQVRSAPNREDFRRLGGRVETHGVGERVDRFLSMRFRFHTREEWRDRLRLGEVLVERNAPRQRDPKDCPRLEGVKHTYRLKSFDQLWMHQPPEYEAGFVNETKILIDTGDEIVFQKPGNLVVHATGLYGRNTFLDVLEEQGFRGVFPVHRLDRETSGILVCARKAQTRHLLARLFRDGHMHKMYLAFVKSGPGSRELLDRFTVDAAIGSALGSAIRLKMWVGEAGDVQEARTHFVTLARSGRYGFVACFPETGRTNQIRVHLAAAGHWILGDKMYHPDEQVFLDFFENGLTAEVLRQTELPRQALHNAAIYADQRVSDLQLFKDGPVVCGLPDDLLESEAIRELLRAAGMPVRGPEQDAFIRSLLEDFRKQGLGPAAHLLRLADLQSGRGSAHL